MFVCNSFVKDKDLNFSYLGKMLMETNFFDLACASIECDYVLMLPTNSMHIPGLAQNAIYSYMGVPLLE